MLLLAIIIVNFCVQCGVQWFFVTCGENNISASDCQSYCISDFGNAACTSPTVNVTLTGYYFFNSTGQNWDICSALVANRPKGQPELTYTDACVSACKDSGKGSRIQAGWITGLDTSNFVDNRPNCEDVPNLQSDILCRSIQLDCGSIIVSIIKIAISVCITIPLSFIMRILLRLAHKSQKCCENRCSFLIGTFVISLVVMGALVVGVYSIIEVVSKKGISPVTIVVEFLISFGVSKLLQLPMWVLLYAVFCCRHKKSMEKKRKKKLKEKLSLQDRQSQNSNEK